MQNILAKENTLKTKKHQLKKQETRIENRITPLSGPVELPDFLTHNRRVVNHTANDNLCFFRCLSIFRGCDKRSCEQDAKQLFAAYRKHFHVDPDLFQGVFLIDFPEIEDFF